MQSATRSGSPLNDSASFQYTPNSSLTTRVYSTFNNYQSSPISVCTSALNCTPLNEQDILHPKWGEKSIVMLRIATKVNVSSTTNQHLLQVLDMRYKAIVGLYCSLQHAQSCSYLSQPKLDVLSITLEFVLPSTLNNFQAHSRTITVTCTMQSMYQLPLSKLHYGCIAALFPEFVRRVLLSTVGFQSRRQLFIYQN